MKHLYSLLTFILLFSSACYAQSRRSYTIKEKDLQHLKELDHHYNDLKKIKTFNFSYERSTGDGEVYYVNNKRVTKEIYYKYQSYNKNIKICNPCILQVYDENDSLEKESISIKGATVDWFRDYYPNGKLKETGQVVVDSASASTHSYNWSSFVKDGILWYFNDKGDTLYYELWDKGKFIKQVPEQNKTEILDITGTLNGVLLNNQPITFKQFRELTFTPTFKNHNRDSLDLQCNLYLGVYESKWHYSEGINQPSFKLDSLKNFDLEKALLDQHVLSTDQLNCSISILNKGIQLVYFPLNIVNEIPKTKDSLNQYLKYSMIDVKMETPPFTFYLVNTADSSKRIEVKDRSSYDVEFHEPLTDTLLISNTHTGSGFIRSLNDTTADSSATLEMFREIFTLDYKNGYTSRTENTYNIKTTDPDNSFGLFKTIPYKQLDAISYQSRARYNENMIGGFVMVASIMTIVAAPFASTDFKKHTFNTEQCLWIAGAGLTGLVISIPILTGGAAKRYQLAPRNSKHDKEFWYLEPSKKKTHF